MEIVRKYILIWILMAPLVSFAQNNLDVPYSRWAIGDSWEVDVTLYSRDWMLSFRDPAKEADKARDRILGRYSVFIEVVAKVSCEGVDCWQIDFVPDENAPGGVREQQYRILVSAEDGAIKRLLRTKGLAVDRAEIENIDGVDLVKNCPYGFPLEIIPWEQPLKKTKLKQLSPRRHQLSTERKVVVVGNVKELSMEVKEDADQRSVVRQKWSQGSWWTEYEKYYRGHLELRAKIKTKKEEK
jgi:hypothetical protein